MTLYLEEEGETALPFDAEALARRVLNGALEYLGCPYETEVDLLLVTDPQMREMNLEYRGIDRTTDVLSFPMAEYETPGDFSFLESDPDSFDPESGELLLGDIVISKDKVLSQAAEYGHSPEREFSFLIVHSVLHLTGYDHIEEQDRILMEQTQEEILEKLQILR